MDGLKAFYNDIVVPFAGGLKSNFAYLLKRWPQETTAVMLALALFFIFLAALRKYKGTDARRKEAQEKKINKSSAILAVIVLIALLVIGSMAVTK